MKWYVFFVKSGKEDYIRDWLCERFSLAKNEFCIPKKIVPEKKNGEVSEATKKNFPGYLFIHTKMDFKKYYTIISNPDILCMLTYRNKKDKIFLYNNETKQQEENNFFMFIHDDEMNVILNLLNVKMILEYSKIFFKDGNFTVTSGPLKGLENKIKKIDKRKKRAKLLIEFAGETKLLDVGIEIVNA